MSGISFAQQGPDNIIGKVIEEKNTSKTIVGANVYWLDSSIGTITNKDGEFMLQRNPNSNKLIISFVGYNTDTIIVEDSLPLEIILQEKIELEEVQIVKKNKSTELTMLGAIKFENLGVSELEKAACCNLSESFETSPSVDVSYTDAITGTKQIQLLGLAGPYTQMTNENIPGMRGLLAIYGLEYIPGPWIESIQLNKGTGSIVNGFESIAGQINIELIKPENADQLYLNLFGNSESRLEANINLNHSINEKFSTGLFIHVRNQSIAMDQNEDGFTDKPTSQNYIFLNRWKYIGDKGYRSQYGIKTTFINSLGGETGFDPEKNNNLWGMQQNTSGIEAWTKQGWISSTRPYQSIGLQIAGQAYNQNSDFGLKHYEGEQRTIYANVIFQSILGTTQHAYRTGLSIQSDQIEEKLDSINFTRNELVPGVYFEYTYSFLDKLNLIAGIRTDYHNLYGAFLTPRVHMRYAFSDNTVIRASAGRGLRTASILSEHSAVLASSRRLNIMGNNTSYPYGLKPEVAWNLGWNLTKKFRLDYRDGAFSIDMYRTQFTEQVVVDLEENPQLIRFYNLEGKSYSSSIQALIDYELIRRLDLRLAYRWHDVQTQYISGIKKKPLISEHRAFLNFAYESRKHWKFDYTVQWQSPKRLPSTTGNPIEYVRPERSPDFFLMNAQISKEWNEKFEIYIGAENITNYKQENPIIAADNPLSDYFDSSLIWGPIFGRMLYTGIRLKLK